jgi:hypothetical protein
MSVRKSVCLSVWTVVCFYQSVTLAEYAVYREIDPDTLATAEVGIARDSEVSGVRFVCL